MRCLLPSHLFFPSAWVRAASEGPMRWGILVIRPTPQAVRTRSAASIDMRVTPRPGEGNAHFRAPRMRTARSLDATNRATMTGTAGLGVVDSDHSMDRDRFATSTSDAANAPQPPHPPVTTDGLTPNAPPGGELGARFHAYRAGAPVRRLCSHRTQRTSFPSNRIPTGMPVGSRERQPSHPAAPHS